MLEGSSAKKVLVVLVAIGLLYWLFSMFESGALMEKLLILPGLVLGLTLHEFAHAKVADRLRRPYSRSAGKTDRKSFGTFGSGRNHMFISSRIWMGKARTD